MKNYSGGFTLIELVVVVLIMGILASMGVPYYYKTIETSKATDSVALGHMIANSNRMFKLDNPGVSLSGQINNDCNDDACNSATIGCRLVACNYVAKQDWDQSSYNFYVCNGSSGGGYCDTSTAVASTKRGSGASGDFANWGYRFSSDGTCTAMGGAPSCPKF